MVPKNGLGKRREPERVAPVIMDGIRYVSDYPTVKMGYIRAEDAATNKRLWQVKIYDVKLNPGKESDVQDVHIRSMTVVEGKLFITNERNDFFELDPITRNVRPIAPTPSARTASSVHAVPLMEYQEGEKAHSRIVEWLRRQKLTPEDYFVSAEPVNKESIRLFHLWHRDIFLPQYQNARGDPTGKCRDISYNTTADRIDSVTYWR